MLVLTAVRFQNVIANSVMKNKRVRDCFAHEVAKCAEGFTIKQGTTKQDSHNAPTDSVKGMISQARIGGTAVTLCRRPGLRRTEARF